MQFIPFGVCHDADDTIGFRIKTPDGAIGFATDVGQITEDLIAQFRGCRLLVLESNHDSELLRVSPYPPSLRSRIGGDDGQIDLEQMAQVFGKQFGGAGLGCRGGFGQDDLCAHGVLRRQREHGGTAAGDEGQGNPGKSCEKRKGS